jgi:hypothetical protein
MNSRAWSGEIVAGKFIDGERWRAVATSGLKQYISQ